MARQTFQWPYAGDIATASTSIATILTIETNPFAPLGSAINECSIVVESKVICFTTASEASYPGLNKQVAVFKKTTVSGLFLQQSGGDIDGGGVGGVLGATQGTVTFDTSGTAIRVRVTPSSTAAHKWLCHAEVTVWQPA